MVKNIENNLQSIGGRLRIALDFNRVTAYEVAFATGISQATLSRILADKTQNPVPANLEKLANYLYLNLEWLVNGKGEMMQVHDGVLFPYLDEVEKKKIYHSRKEHKNHLKRIQKDVSDAIDYISELEAENEDLTSKYWRLKEEVEKLIHRYNITDPVPLIYLHSLGVDCEFSQSPETEGK